MISPVEETAISGSETSSLRVTKSEGMLAGIGSTIWRHFQYRLLCLSTRWWSLSFSSRICVSLLLKTFNKQVTSLFRSLQHSCELTVGSGITPNNSEYFAMMAVWRSDNEEELSSPRRLARPSISDTLVVGTDEGR